MNRVGLLTIASMSCLTLCLSATSPCAGEADDGRPLILEMRRGGMILEEVRNGVIRTKDYLQIECQVTAGQDFFAGTTVNGVRHTIQGHVGNIENGVVTLDVELKSHAESATHPRVSYREMELKIDDFNGSAMGGKSPMRPAPIFWIRRGTNPLPVVRRILARQDDSFGWAIQYLEGPGTRAIAAIPELVDALSKGADPPDGHPYDCIRRYAAQALGKIGPPAKKAVPALVQALHDPNGYVRINAAVALWRIAQYRGSVAALITEKKHEERDIRLHAVAALGDIATPEHAAKAVPVLIEALQDEDYGVRLQACYALAKFQATAKPALPALRDARNDENKDVRRAAAYALDQIGKQ